jgi:hypothetical protein
MAGKYTEAQKRATAKFQKKLKSLSIRISEEEYEKYSSAAKRLNVPLRQFVLSSMNEKILKEDL